MMTLDEAIKHCNEVACKHDKCSTEHKQLAQWLTELKSYRVSVTQGTQKTTDNSELKELEDEKIRKEIIEYIKTGTYHKNWITWLEKQKDTSSIERVFRPDAGCTITNAATQAIEQQKLGYKIVLAFNGAYIPVEEKTVKDIINEYYSWVEKGHFEKKNKD